MNEEYRSLMMNDTRGLEPLSKVRKLVKCECVHKTRYASNVSVEKHEAQ